MRHPTLQAKRTTFRPTGEHYVRITADGCVLDTDMHMLKPQEIFKVSVCGEEKVKDFQRLLLNDKLYYADVVTGTLFDGQTGASANGQMIMLMRIK